MENSVERRRCPRAQTTIRVEPLNGGPPMEAHDISLGGMLVTSPSLRWPGELVRIRFCLPGETHAIRASCRVIDIVETPTGAGLALQFLGLHPEAQLQLHRYVDGRPSSPPEDDSVTSLVQAWVRRIVEDCAQLGALARPN